MLSQLGVPRSTYYRWLKRMDDESLEGQAGGGRPAWNRLTPEEVDRVLEAAQETPELSCRQLAAWSTDYGRYAVSESTVYRILRREGLVKRAEVKLVAGKEYHRKTTAPHQMWATALPTSGHPAGASTTWSPSRTVPACLATTARATCPRPSGATCKRRFRRQLSNGGDTTTRL